MLAKKPKNNNAGRPSICRSCGAIVGAGQDACAVCGAPLTAAQNRTGAAVAYDRETMRFARAVLSRPYIFTIVFLIINFFVFLLMWRSSGMSLGSLWIFPEPVLVAFGAKLNSLIDQQPHQWWRFVTPMFVHVGLLHLLVNMYSLWMVGPYVEKLYGSAKFVFFWVATGVAGVVASYLTVLNPGTPLSALGRFIFKTQDGPSAGASGALFGLVGVLFVFGIKFRHELPEGFKRAFGTGLLPVIMINLFIGYMARGLIDNAAHLGGLISGASLALVISYRRPGERSSLALAWQVLQIAALALVAISFARVVQHSTDPMPLLSSQDTQLDASTKTHSAYLAYQQALNDGQDAFGQAVLDGNVNRPNEAIQALTNAPHLDNKADNIRDGLKSLVVRARDFAKEPPSDPKMKIQQQKRLQAEFEVWSREYQHWLETIGKNY